ncbi:hypothetical protein FRB93_011597 [Tulasnella sp. JGI-2019a]|nr:hypothetical protein FRB93_011597 [Tulasnella sp. JGI-2019a]
MLRTLARSSLPIVSRCARIPSGLPKLPHRTFMTSPSRRLPGFTNMLSDHGAPPPPVMVKRMTDAGVELIDGLLIPRSCIFLDGRVFLWDALPPPKGGNLAHLTKEMFEMFEVVVPKPELLILGTGHSTLPVPPEIRKYLSSIGVGPIDVMDTWNACSTFNMLAEEGRRVAAALLVGSPDGSWKLSQTTPSQ